MIYFWVILATLSIVINIFLVLYIRENLDFLKTLRGNIYEISGNLDDFTKHLDKVYNLDTFYGDNTLDGLLKHVKEVSVEINNGRELIEKYFNG